MQNDIQNLNCSEFCNPQPQSTSNIGEMKSINSYLQSYDHLLDDEYYKYGAVRRYPKLLVFDTIMKESGTGPTMYKMEKLYNMKNYIFEPIERFRPTIDLQSPINMGRKKKLPRLQRQARRLKSMMVSLNEHGARLHQYDKLISNAKTKAEKEEFERLKQKKHQMDQQQKQLFENEVFVDKTLGKKGRRIGRQVQSMSFMVITGKK